MYAGGLRPGGERSLRATGAETSEKRPLPRVGRRRPEGAEESHPYGALRAATLGPHRSTEPTHLVSGPDLH